MLKYLLISLVALPLSSCIEHAPPSILSDDVNNPGDIWISGANKAASGAANQYDLVVSAPAGKDNLIICEADHPEKCNQTGSKQFTRVAKMEGLNKNRSFFKVQMTVMENMVLAMKAWANADTTAVGRVVDVTKTAGPGAGAAGASAGAAGTGATKTYAEIKSLIDNNCAGCHIATNNNPQQAKAKATPMDTYASMISAGQTPKTYVTQMAASVQANRMPKNAPPTFTAQQRAALVQALQAWQRGGFKQQ